MGRVTTTDGHTKEELAQSSHREGPTSTRPVPRPARGLPHKATIGAMEGHAAFTSGISTCTRHSDHGGSLVLGPEETVLVTYTHVHTTVQITHLM